MSLDDLCDAVYTLLRYYTIFKKWPNLFYPKSFNEYLFRKKLLDRNPLLTQLADKYSVRDYVAERIGTEYLNKLLLVTSTPEEIDFDQLPEQFAIKATHGSGYNFFVTDKNLVDRNEVVKLCQTWLAADYYQVGKEWCYKNIPRKIIVEELLRDHDGKSLTEFKFYCFGGIPKFVSVHKDRYTEFKRSVHDMEWNKLPIKYKGQNIEWVAPKPLRLAEMIAVASKLSHGLDFIRVDLYSDDTRVIFGEMTNYPDNGSRVFIPPQYDLVYGKAWATYAPNASSAKVK